MPRRILTLLLLPGILGASAALADIYECVDANGSKRFTNIKAEAKGCKVLNISPTNTVPSPAGSSGSGRASATPTPPSFPRVDANTQRERDLDRRRILEQELASERKLLDQARRDLTEQESIRLGSERNYQRVLDRLEPFKKKVRLHEDNVNNLNKELRGLR